MEEYTADDRGPDERGEGHVVSLGVQRRLWAERDERYEGQTLKPGQRDAIIAYRVRETDDLPERDRANARREALAWQPPL